MSKQKSLTEMVSIRTLEKIQDNFSIATGISCVMRDLNGNTITKMSSPSELWQTVTKNKEISDKAAKVLLQAFDKSIKTGQIEIIPRYFDLHAFLAPIFVDGRIIAFFIGGLTRFGNPNIQMCTEECAKLGIDLDSFLEMYWSLPLVCRERLEACANLFKTIATMISQIAKEGTEAKAKVTEITAINRFLEQEIMKSNEDLFEKEALYHNLFNTINDGAYVTDYDGIIIDINQTGANILGYERHELIGKNMKTVYVHPEDRDAFLVRLYKQGNIKNFNPFVRLKNGQEKYFETNSTVIRNSGGKIIGVQGIFRDIDHRIHSSIIEDVTTNTTIESTSDNQSAHKAS
ncbi:PocR ligand-binding domain-containing protein [Patescibacteria group bacterium]|nr:PocR ligand-binding domain-containing protein [Patescibacteria group bacterium]